LPDQHQINAGDKMSPGFRSFAVFRLFFSPALFLCLILSCRGHREPDANAGQRAADPASPAETEAGQAIAEAAAVMEKGEEPPDGWGAGKTGDSPVKAEPAAAGPSGQRTAASPAGAGQNSREASFRGELTALNSIRPPSGRGVAAGELNPVNYQTVNPAVLLQMGMEPYQVSFIMGERYLNGGSYDRALVEYNKAIKLKANYAEALFSRGRAYQLKGDFARALEDYSRTIGLKRDSPAAFNHRGYIYAQRGDHPTAIGDYTQALALKRDYGDALYNRGYSYRLLGQYDKAIEDFTRLLQLEPKNPAAYNQRGTAWYYKENDDRAIRDFSEAIRLKNDYALAWHNRGTAYRMSGNTTRAEADFAEARRLGYR
jgi:tetratricopeptide (TPR) repeat protein